MSAPSEHEARRELAAMPQVANPSWLDPFAEGVFWPAMLRKAERDFPGFSD